MIVTPGRALPHAARGAAAGAASCTSRATRASCGCRRRVPADVCVPLAILRATPGEVTVWRDRCRRSTRATRPRSWLSALLGRPRGWCASIPRHRRRATPRGPAGAEAAQPLLGRLSRCSRSRARRSTTSTRGCRRPLPMDRFRPNLVLDGLPPYGEDALQRPRPRRAAPAGREALHALQHHDHRPGDGRRRRRRAAADAEVLPLGRRAARRDVRPEPDRRRGRGLDARGRDVPDDPP